MKIFYRDILSISVLLAFFTSYALAESKHSASSSYYLASNQKDGISEQTALTIAQIQINGHALKIRHVNDVYRIKILSNKNTVHTVTVNSINGKIISPH